MRGRHAEPGFDALRQLGVVFIGLKLALVPILFDPAGEDAFGVIKSAGSRSLLYLLLAVAGPYLLFVEEGRARLWRARGIVLAILAFAAVSAVATALAVDRYIGLFGAHHRYLGLASTLDGIALALAIVTLTRDRRDLIIVLGGLFGGALVILGYAGLQLAHLDPLSWKAPGVFSTMGNRGFLAGYLLVLASAGLIVALGARLAPRWRIVAVTFAATCAAVLVATGARGPTLALPVALALVTTLVLHHRLASRFGRARRLALLAAFAAAILGASAPIAVPRLTTLVGGDGSVVERGVVYRTALEMIAARPVLGSGPDTFGVLYPAFRGRSAAEVGFLAPAQTSTHSWPLHHAVGSGLLGLSLLVVIVALALRGGLVASDPLERPAVLGAAIVLAFLLQGAFNASDIVGEMLFWVGVGLTAVTLSPPLAPATRPGRCRLLVAGSLLAFAILLALTTVNWVLANREVLLSDSHRVAGRIDLAESAALRATQHDPGRSNNWNVLGLARSLRSPQSALGPFEEAANRSSRDPVYLLNLAREEALASRTDARLRDRAVAHAQSAVGLDPNGVTTLARVAELMVFLGNGKAALDYTDAIISLAPRDPRGYELAAEAYAAAGDAATAAERLRAMIESLYHSDRPPPELRIRLADFYRATGDVDKARASYAAPRVIDVQRPCPRHVDAATLPWCLTIRLAGEEYLVADPRVSSSVHRPENYAIDGRPLPAGTRITYDAGESSVTLLFPTSALPPTTGATLRMTGITDTRGAHLESDPTKLLVPPTIYSPPRVSLVATPCTVHDSARSSWCVGLLFTSSTAIDDATVSDPSHYLLAGQPLPRETLIRNDGGMVKIQLPLGAPSPARGAIIEVREVRDRLGVRLDPDPTILIIR